ncbi:thermonuclease family protein [Liberiplasma polymorphum]|uniref:thermonuclease family protein n=1 Tax=Liberiplasma polymorphum TaxID=3374570 RepID=UPI00377636FC
MSLQKKLSIIFISVLMVFTLAACKGEPDTQTPLTDNLSIDFNYEGKSYLEDGYGVATLVSCEDGDTAEFLIDDVQIRVRFLGVDTPEASYKYEPWGYQATLFACGKLAEAEEIVLERNFDGPLRDTYGRYLAFIWYDGRLLNLELIEESYSQARGVISLKYGVLMFDAGVKAAEGNLRIHGEIDPLFDYSAIGEAVSIETLVKNYDDYLFRRVSVEGVVTARVGIHFFIENDGYGIYINAGYTDTSALEVGNYIKLEHVQVIYDLERYGGLHLVDYLTRNVTVIDEITSVIPKLTTIDALTENEFGKLVELHQLEITKITEIDEFTYYLIVEDQNGNELTIYHPEGAFMADCVNIDTFEVGMVINIIGPLQNSITGNILYLSSPDYLTVIE